jgi:hypothetical protein
MAKTLLTRATIADATSSSRANVADGGKRLAKSDGYPALLDLARLTTVWPNIKPQVMGGL